MPLPKAIRARVPNGLRDEPRVRAVAVAAGLIPPRPMHSPREAAFLADVASECRCAVEIGVYEGSSALVFCDAMTPGTELHLIDPFVDESGASLPPGWQATPLATRLVVWRAARGRGPDICWHIARSQDVGKRWDGPQVDLVFIDGDHASDAVREDWDVWHRHVRIGGTVAFHDARLGKPGGDGGPGPTGVVDELFRGPLPPEGWGIHSELDSLVAVTRAA